MFATKLHTQGTTVKAEALRTWCALGSMELGQCQDSSYLVKRASIMFANPEAGT